jgi:hypothetical protein
VNGVCLPVAPCARLLAASLAALLLAMGPPRTLAEPPRREVASGYSTTRVISGVPYDLAGKRITLRFRLDKADLYGIEFE